MTDDESTKKRLLRQGSSICAPDPYQQLLSALQDHDLDSFKSILETGVKRGLLDPNHWYEDPHYGTLLDIACRSLRNSQYVQVLLQNGADPNKINHIRHKSALHSVVEIGDKESLQVLLNHESTNVNLLDNTGSSALHLVCKNNKFELLHILLNNPKVRVNQVNRKGQTAISLAALGKYKDIVLTLLKYKGVDIDTAKTAQGKSSRDVILEKLPELASEIPEKSETTIANIPETNQLFYYLYQFDEESFMSSLSNLKNESNNVEDIVNSDDGSYTFLQYTSEYGFVESVGLLLEMGANPNKTNPNNIKTPIMIASYKGYYEIVKLLAEHDKVSYEPSNDETVLHSVIQGINTMHDYLAEKKHRRDHIKCFKYLLNNVARHKININQQDSKGNTILHYAAKNGNPDLTLMLLRHGVYIGTRNKFNEPALQDIPPRLLETYLDECLQTNNLRKEDPKYELIFRYNFLVPPRVETYDTMRSDVSLHIEDNPQTSIHDNKVLDVVSETDPLLYMSQSKELRPLLVHPVLTSFIHLKWFSIRRFFYINLSFYLTFWFVLSAYILSFYSNPNYSPNGNITNINVEDVQTKPMKSELLLWTLLLLCLVIFVLRELFQIVVSPVKYFKSLENWLEIFLIGITAVILFSVSSVSQNQISAVAILLAWVELVLLIGRYPSLATYIEMFKTVSWNFLKFLAWYSILILAFALSFYTLFKDDTSEENVFIDPGNSLFKTLVMLTGEFDAGSIPFVKHPFTSHILFVLFVFLIAIILINLLNGLAVSDTAEIRSNSQLLGYISIIKLISYIETIAIGDPTFRHIFNKLKSYCCFTADSCSSLEYRSKFSNRVNLFPDIISENEIIVYPNKDRRVDFTSLTQKKLSSSMSSLDASCYARCQQYNMDPEIIKDAKQIIHDRESEKCSMEEMFSEYTQRLNLYQLKLDSLEKQSAKNQKILQAILNSLKNKNSSSDDD